MGRVCLCLEARLRAPPPGFPKSWPAGVADTGPGVGCRVRARSRFAREGAVAPPQFPTKAAWEPTRIVISGSGRIPELRAALGAVFVALCRSLQPNSSKAGCGLDRGCEAEGNHPGGRTHAICIACPPKK